MQRRNNTSADEWKALLTARIDALQRLFRAGEASPYDVDLEGNTLLHVRGVLTSIPYYECTRLLILSSVLGCYRPNVFLCSTVQSVRFIKMFTYPVSRRSWKAWCSSQLDQ